MGAGRRGRPLESSLRSGDSVLALALSDCVGMSLGMFMS